MPQAWDVTSLTGKPGSGGCTTDSAADGWAKCKAVYTFLTAQSKHAATYATSPLWSVVDGPWKLSSFSTAGNVTMVPNKELLRQPQAAAVGDQVRALHGRLRRVHRAEDRAGRRRRTSRRGPAAEAGQLGPAGDQPAGQRLQPAAVLLVRHPLRASRTSTTRRSASWSGSSTSGRPCRSAFDQPGIDKAIYRGYAVPTSGPAPNAPPGNQWIPRYPDPEQRPGPVPVRHRQGEVAADQPWLVRGRRRDDLPGPGQVRHRHHQGPAG